MAKCSLCVGLCRGPWLAGMSNKDDVDCSTTAWSIAKLARHQQIQWSDCAPTARAPPSARTHPSHRATIRPLLELEYATPVIHNMSTTNVKIFEKIQNKCLRIIAQSPPQKSSHILRKQLNIPTMITGRQNYLYDNFSNFKITYHRNSKKIT